MTGLRRILAGLGLIGAISLAGCQGLGSLAGPTWQWTGPEANTASQSSLPDRATYVIEFQADGTVVVTADCNTVTGTYAIEIPLDLTIQLESPSLADCGGDSLDGVYLESLGRVRSYSTDSGELTLFFADDVEGMRFEQ